MEYQSQHKPKIDNTSTCSSIPDAQYSIEHISQRKNYASYREKILMKHLAGLKIVIMLFYLPSGVLAWLRHTDSDNKQTNITCFIFEYC